MSDADRPTGRIVVDGRPIAFQAGDSVADAILRAGEQPARGGTLCLAGDCPNCLASVDGIAYVRTCQVACRPGLAVERHPREGLPALPVIRSTNVAATPPEREIRVERREVEVAVIGGGPSGRAAAAAAEADGRGVLVLDAHDGVEVAAIYPGASIVARQADGMLHVRADEIVVATGAAEIQPVCPGSELAGLLTARAAEHLHAIGIDLGRAVAVGAPPAGVPCERVFGELVRFLGDEAGRVRAVVATDPRSGVDIETACDTVILGLGYVPRDVLARMAGPATGVPVRVVGDAAADHALPPAPTDPAAIVCPCHRVTVEDLDVAWGKGFQELELLKRATLAGIGPCQGGACLPHVRAWIAARDGGVVPEPFTARPATRQITIGEAAADVYIDAFRRTPLHDEHLAAGRPDGPVRGLVATVALRRSPRRVLGRARGRLDR